MHGLIKKTYMKKKLKLNNKIDNKRLLQFVRRNVHCVKPKFLLKEEIIIYYY